MEQWAIKTALKNGIYTMTQRPIRNPGEKRGRNEPCVCGSGKKWKKCCGGPSKND